MQPVESWLYDIHRYVYSRCKYRYKTTVSPAREKVYKIVRTETDMARFDWLLFTEGIPNVALIYPKSHAECRDSVFDWQIND